jgi:hypothetical protein
MRVPFCSTGLKVSKSALDRKKKTSAKYQEPKIIQEKKLLLYIEDDMRVPFCSRGLNVSKAAHDQKKKEVARNKGVKKSKKRNISIGLLLAIWAFKLSRWTPFDSYNFSPFQNRKVLCLAKTKKNKEIQHISLFM